MTAEGILVVGEALVDIVHRASGAMEEAPGGSPANVAITLGRLGRAPRFVTRLADDDRGCRVRQWLEDSGVDVTAVPAPRTATAVARLDAKGAARYEFDLDWDLSEDVGALIASGSAGLRVVHVGSVAAVLEPGAGQIASLVRSLREHAVVTYDPNIRPALVDDPAAVRVRVAERVALADVVKASDEDLRWLHPGRDLVEVAREWQQRGPALVVVTGGDEGAFAVAGETVVDTVGAGDTFMGALIDGLVGLGVTPGALRAPGGGIRPHDLEVLLDRCARAAAITVARPGADPPWLAELTASTH